MLNASFGDQRIDQYASNSQDGSMKRHSNLTTNRRVPAQRTEKKCNLRLISRRDRNISFERRVFLIFLLLVEKVQGKPAHDLVAQS